MRQESVAVRLTLQRFTGPARMGSPRIGSSGKPADTDVAIQSECYAPFRKKSDEVSTLLAADAKCQLCFLCSEDKVDTNEKRLLGKYLPVSVNFAFFYD
jgi:hypothetical protein